MAREEALKPLSSFEEDEHKYSEQGHSCDDIPKCVGMGAQGNDLEIHAEDGSNKSQGEHDDREGGEHAHRKV